MAGSRFFIDAELAAGVTIALPKGVAHHATHVLRLRDGDPVVLFNGRGGEFHGALAGTGVVVARQVDVERESPVDVTLVQAWIATDKLEWVIEKAVELGAAGIVLIPARRSVVRLDPERLGRRIERLREIALAACCQCGRNRVPSVRAAADAAAVLRDAGVGTTGLVLQPDAPRSLRDIALSSSGRTPFVVAVGPEGGFEDGEVALAQRAGYCAARIGPRVLRTETAGLAALATLQAAVGDYV